MLQRQTGVGSMAQFLNGFALERLAQRSYRYFEQLVDRSGQPYFNVFWTDPPEAAHDWPDFGDVTARQLQAAIMIRTMSGVGTPIESVWREQLLSWIDPQSGRYKRPVRTYTTSLDPAYELGDIALTLYTLVTLWMDGGDPVVLRSIRNLCDQITELTANGLVTRRGMLTGFMIRSLTAAARFADVEEALDTAQILINDVWSTESLFTYDNRLAPGAHMHGSLRTLLGCADFALALGDREMLDRTAAVLRFVQSIATRFGFLPEVYCRPDSLIACETCALMDYMALSVTLANHGYPEFWGIAARLLRNHLIESMIIDADWLGHHDGMDTEQFSTRRVSERIVGAWAGWSSPNHLLAYRETLHWGGPELRGKPRVLQNCCGGSGPHALFIAWKNAARVQDDILSVNLLVDKLLPQAEIRSALPWVGRVSVHLHQDMDVRIRLPEFVQPADVRVGCSCRGVQVRFHSGWLEIDSARADELYEINFPLPIVHEEVRVGNPGFREWVYEATWKGDSVVRLEPDEANDVQTVWSSVEQADVPVYYAADGPGALYDRGYLLEERDPAPPDLQMDTGRLDMWWFR